MIRRAGFPGATLEGGLYGAADNFLALRHLAALLVIYGHSFRLSHAYPTQVDGVEAVLPGFYAGSVAVLVFFAASGFLVTLSLLHAPGVWRYVRNRFLRVYPGYLAAVLFAVFVIGPWFTTLDVASYFPDPGTWRHLSTNLVPITFAWTLPGVFTANPFPGVVNGTLWSLGLEVRWYAYLGVLALLGVASRRWAFTAVALGFLGFASWQALQGKPDPQSFRLLSMVFMGSGLLAHWRRHIRVGHVAMALLAVACVVLRGQAWHSALVVVAVVHAVFWFAYAVPPLPWPHGIDYSYGLFLYGFPVQQALLATSPGLEPLPLFALSLLLALGLAALSWHWVESPMLAFKRQPARTPAAAV